jgi:hypothetical protein
MSLLKSPDLNRFVWMSGFIVLFVVSFCTKKEGEVGQYQGEATAIKNGALWSASPRCLINKPYGQGIDIDMDVFNSANHLKESLFFFKLPDQEGDFSLTLSDIREVDDLHGAVYHILQDDGTAGDSYDLLEGMVENRLKITEKKGDEYWGEFQAAFVKTTEFGEQDPTAPDTVVFSEGRFHVKLKK